ncbi:sugar ABC transporter ATP-binding protein [Erwiniaceae bacterium BAC15a-03b]|uniref:Autoinducer 2 import ATP-binding protein LsrA n=1 Tax=Winslowiella arboricola TaxID=2978220 RepID=A0A9J6PLB4_9GAMM|nr:sugar ABC transporter ATP-binding protein [Winslowiella arboricola]MCU5773227.1 sugar ABC transporter ATP-binding protein [Winslowiella arboricola]MCU5779113.1 sugar ABC transporter ATP-binding protein [Winslowiella arboricola]
MAILEVENLGRDFPGVTALNNINLAFASGRVHILAGENGAGKSTLVKLLTGTDSPSRGAIRIDGEDPLARRALFNAVAYVPQELSLFPHMSVAENLFIPYNRSGFSGRYINFQAINREAQRYLDTFSIEARAEERVRNISISDQQLLQIARASTNKQMKVLILDEPTSSLTRTEVERVFRVIADFKARNLAILFISHKLDELFAIGDDYTVLRNGEIIESGRINETSEAGLIKAMSGTDMKINAHFRPIAAPQPDKAATIIRVEQLSGRRFNAISFTLKRGEILGFAGLVGAGRSEVMQTLFGYLPASGGRVTVNGQPWKLGSPPYSVKNGMLYLSEERKLHGILPLLSVRENIGIAVIKQTLSWSGIAAGKEKSLVRKVIKAYEVKTSNIETRITFLSGGNQQKTIIGRAMATRPEVLIFDEPTKGIDVMTKVEIYKIMRSLCEDGVGIILVSSELEELYKCANRIITLHNGAITGDFPTATTDTETLVRAIFAPVNHDAA